MESGVPKKSFALAVVWLLIPAAFFFLGQPLSFSVEEIWIRNVNWEPKGAGKFFLGAEVTNMTSEPREAILRAQLSFYDKASPHGDVPLSILRKDTTIILKAYEKRRLELILIDEGSPLQAELRIEPSLRLRRQRVWNY